MKAAHHITLRSPQQRSTLVHHKVSAQWVVRPPVLLVVEDTRGRLPSAKCGTVSGGAARATRSMIRILKLFSKAAFPSACTASGKATNPFSASRMHLRCSAIPRNPQIWQATLSMQLVVHCARQSRLDAWPCRNAPGLSFGSGTTFRVSYHRRIFKGTVSSL